MTEQLSGLNCEQNIVSEMGPVVCQKMMEVLSFRIRYIMF